MCVCVCVCVCGKGGVWSECVWGREGCGVSAVTCLPVVTIFNTAPGAALSDDFFPCTDVLVLNETEVHHYIICTGHYITSQAEVLTGCAVSDVASAKLAVQQLLIRGPGGVVVTLGAGGVVFSGRGSGRDTITHIPAEAVTAIDTTVS